MNLPDETIKCLKTILLEDKNHSTSKISGQTYHSKHQFRVFSLRSPCSLRLSCFEAEYKTKAFQCAFEIDGLITGFDVHPSKDYIVLTSDLGYYYIF
jgi:hypothetical protein